MRGAGGIAAVVPEATAHAGRAHRWATHERSFRRASGRQRGSVAGSTGAGQCGPLLDAGAANRGAFARLARPPPPAPRLTIHSLPCSSTSAQPGLASAPRKLSRLPFQTRGPRGSPVWMSDRACDERGRCGAARVTCCGRQPPRAPARKRAPRSSAQRPYLCNPAREAGDLLACQLLASAVPAHAQAGGQAGGQAGRRAGRRAGAAGRPHPGVGALLKLDLAAQHDWGTTGRREGQRGGSVSARAPVPQRAPRCMPQKRAAAAPASPGWQHTRAPLGSTRLTVLPALKGVRPAKVAVLAAAGVVRHPHLHARASASSQPRR